MNVEHYISGLEGPGQILGILDIGLNPGVSLLKLTPKMIKAIQTHQNKKIKLFVDSGAFSEIKVINNEIQIVKPITPKRWNKILDTYQILAEATHFPLVVAPDAVGDQDKTIQRLKTYKNILNELSKKTRVVVPLQKGKYNTIDFQNICLDLLGFPFTSGIPYKKKALSIEDYINILKHTEQRNIHILGVSKAARRWPKIKYIHSQIPHNLSTDSARIRALVGRKPKPHPFTNAQDIARQNHPENTPAPIIHRAAINLIGNVIDAEYSKTENVNIFPL